MLLIQLKITHGKYETAAKVGLTRLYLKRLICIKQMFHPW